MANYKAPVDDILFILNNVLQLESYGNVAGFTDINQETVEAILREGAKICEEELLPLNQTGDQEGCVWNNDNSVTTPKGFKAAYEKYCEGSWGGISADPEYGGSGLPFTISAILNEFTCSSNMAFAMYPGLTQSAIAALTVHGSDEQKKQYLPNLISGKWSGTMNLTEPHCGTDLGLLRTKARKNADGSFNIEGTKIFISAGEHDLTENIIHLVLARIEGAPEGTKGISLFIVPKYNINEDGSVGEQNKVSCGSIEKKMGIHANSTCVMNYDGARGWLVGEENKGLRAMFTMMNEARLGVSIQGLALSETAYQNAAIYANERLQGRSISGVKEPEKSADPIIVHPDIRRTLMTIRAFNEGARAFVLWISLNVDLFRRSEDEKTREAAEDLLGLMTPILKGYLTDKGFENTVNAQQVYGGHGYIVEHGMEQIVRDARIAMIYEGANGVQAMDLVGRKLGANGGRAIMQFMGQVKEFIKENSENTDLEAFTKPLETGIGQVQEAAMWFMNNAMAKPDHAGAGATDFLQLLGTVTIGYMWAKMAKVANEEIAKNEGNKEFLSNKLVIGKFYMERMMPMTNLHLTRITAGADTMMTLPAEAFIQ